MKSIISIKNSLEMIYISKEFFCNYFFFGTFAVPACAEAFSLDFFLSVFFGFLSPMNNHRLPVLNLCYSFKLILLLRNYFASISKITFLILTKHASPLKCEFCFSIIHTNQTCLPFDLVCAEDFAGTNFQV